MSGDVSPAQRLTNAESDAARLPAAEDSLVLPCQRHVIEVRVLDEDDAPLTAVPVALFDDAGRALRSKTDSTGIARFTGLVKKPYQYSLYSLGETVWEETRTTPVANAKSDAGEPPWAVAESGGAAEETYVVQQDECVTKLADRFGLTPADIWSANTTLAADRASMDILAPRDTLVIPTRTLKRQPAKIGHRHTARRKSAMTWLRIRFLDAKREARAGIPYVISVERLCARPVADVADETTDEGMVIQEIPADASIARVTLDAEEEQEVHVFHLSRLDPVSLPRGIQARLNNLGYGCGDEDGTIGPVTELAISCFQRDLLLKPTGEADADTIAALVSLHGS